MDMQEYEQAILEKYDIKVAGTRKTRGAILCDTDQGVLLLREVTGAVKRMPVLCGLYDFLRLEGFEKTDYILRTKEKECVAVMDDGRTYVLKRWFEGRECDVKRPGEILACSGELAKLHIIMCGRHCGKVCVRRPFSRRLMKRSFLFCRSTAAITGSF